MSWLARTQSCQVFDLVPELHQPIEHMVGALTVSGHQLLQIPAMQISAASLASGKAEVIGLHVKPALVK